MRDGVLEKLSNNSIKEMFKQVATVMKENCEYLCSLDANMGDGDLGLTMSKGFGAFADALEMSEENNISRLIYAAAMKMASAAPSTMGTLMASGIMGGAKAIDGDMAIGALEYCKFLDGFASAIAARGKCKPGDCTVLDAIHHAVLCAKDTLKQKETLKEVAYAANIGAEKGLTLTIMMESKFGKAAVFRSKSIGIADQGAVVGALLLKTMSEYISAHCVV